MGVFFIYNYKFTYLCIMKTIELSKNGKYAGKYVALVDDEDYDRVNKYNWTVLIDKKKHNIYVQRSVRLAANKWTTQRLHIFILGEKPGFMIDHEDRNGLNNQKSNLRYCTNSDNQKNQRSSGKSKYLGVHFCGSYSKWKAQININFKRTHIGYFDNEIDAAQAYDNAAKIHHKEFANLNFK